jgi:type I restriction enzyme, S subunit
MEPPNSPQYVWVGPEQVDRRLDTRPFKPWVIERVQRCHSFKSGTVRLGDPGVCSLLSRGAGGGQESENTVAVLKAKEITGYGFAKPELFLSDCPAAKLLRPDDVVLTSSGIGTIGRADLIDGISLPPESPHTVDNHVTIIRLKRGRLRPGYLAAFLNSAYGKAWSEWGTTGSTRLLELPPSMVRAFAIPRPDIKVQEHIAGQLRLAARCRAESAARLVAANQALGAALGVHVGPESFKVQSAADVSADGYQVASLSPVMSYVASRRVGSQISPQFFTPRRAKALLVIERSGATAVPLRDIAERYAARIAPEEAVASGIPFVGLEQIDAATGYIASDGGGSPAGASARFGAGDILFSKLRPYLNKVAICPAHLGSVAGSTELLTYRVTAGVDQDYLCLVMRSHLVLNQVVDVTSGLTHPRVDPALVDDVSIPLAKPAEQKRIGRLYREALSLKHRAVLLTNEANADVEALIEGTLDVQAILAGTLKQPTADDIPELAEAGA